MKLCKKCGTEKPLSEFYDDKRHSGGKASRCRECDLTNAKARAAARRSDPEFLKAETKRGMARYHSVRGRAQHLLRRAKLSPDGCTLALDDVIKGIERGHCSVTGIQFDLKGDRQRIAGRSRNPYSPSLDRISPHFGYTPENTRVVIWQYNAMKGEITDAEVIFICQQVIERCGDARP